MTKAREVTFVSAVGTAIGTYGGVDLKIMGIGPVPAVRSVMQKNRSVDRRYGPD